MCPSLTHTLLLHATTTIKTTFLFPLNRSSSFPSTSSSTPAFLPPTRIAASSSRSQPPPPPSPMTQPSLLTADHPHATNAIIEDHHHSRAADLLQLSNKGPIWIFGFGSLVHTPGFPFSQRKHGFIKGFRRCWYQGSTDHRGTPTKPGRTVTLVEDPTAVTWGTVYQLAGSIEEQLKTLAYLEWREKQYDRREQVAIWGYGDGDESNEQQAKILIESALCYIATGCSQANPNYLGPAPLPQVAQQIATCVGPSGPNYEYLFKLADAIRAIPHARDEELFVLEKKVKELLPPNR